MPGFAFFNRALERRPLFPYNDHISKSWLTTIFRNKWFEELIYWSSPSLHAELLKLKAGELSPEKKVKVVKSLYRYLLRSYSRCTPFGITAGFYTTALEKTNAHDCYFPGGLEVGPWEGERRIVSPDSKFLAALIKSILAETPIASNIRYHLNPTIYKMGNSIRFHERLEEGNHRISTIEGNEIINELASHIKTGCTIEFMLHHLGDEFDFKEKSHFIYSLIEESILVHEFEYVANGKTSITKLAQHLAILTDDASVFFKGILKKYQSVIDHLEQSDLGDYCFEDIQRIKSDLRAFIDSKSLQNLYHIDLVVPPNTKSIKPTDLDLISECIECLAKVIIPQNSKAETITKFNHAFFERYNNEVVPLLEVLDSDSGLGFPVSRNFGVKQESELLSDIRISKGNVSTKHISFSSKNKVRKKIDKLLSETNSVDLSELDLSGLDSHIDSLPKTFSVVCSKLSSGNVLLSSIGGSSSLNLLGRFSIGNEEVHSLCQEIVLKEKEIFKDVIIAEIVFIPEGKSGNVTKKKVLTDYFIPVNAGLDIPTKQAIPLNDLYVTIEKQQIILISKKLNKRVLPRLSSAHNYHNSSSEIYKFLCSIQHHHVLEFSLDHVFTEEHDILRPRVSYKGVIIRPAWWKLRFHHYKHLLDSDFNSRSLKRFLNKLGLPNELAIKEGDNELPLKLDKKIDLRIIWDYFKKKRNINIIEWLHYEDATEKAPQYVHQTIISMFQRDSLSQNSKDWFSESESQRFFLPGSEVLSCKIYCGAFIADDVLRVVLSEIGSKLINAKLIKLFYFVRYNDPHHHIRVRFFIEDFSSHIYSQVLNEITNCIAMYKKQGLVWKMEIDTYEREIKRYAAINIELAEFIFYQDSYCFLSCLTSLPSLDDDLLRISIGIVNVQYWLKLVDFDYEMQTKFLRKRIIEYKKEFGEEVEIKQLNDLYRKYKLAFNNFDRSQVEIFFKNRNLKIAREMRKYSKESESMIPVLQDMIHMSQNRLFNSSPRLNEYIVYSLTEKLMIAHQFEIR